MLGKPAGWSPTIEDENTPWSLLLVAIIAQAVDDLDRQPNKQHSIDPAGARQWLLQTAPALLEAMGLEVYAGRLLEMIKSKPEPDTYQLSFDLLEVV